MKLSERFLPSHPFLARRSKVGSSPISFADSALDPMDLAPITWSRAQSRERLFTAHPLCLPPPAAFTSIFSPLSPTLLPAKSTLIQIPWHPKNRGPPIFLPITFFLRRLPPLPLKESFPAFVLSETVKKIPLFSVVSFLHFFNALSPTSSPFLLRIPPRSVTWENQTIASPFPPPNPPQNREKVFCLSLSPLSVPVHLAREKVE